MANKKAASKDKPKVKPKPKPKVASSNALRKARKVGEKPKNGKRKA